MALRRGVTTRPTFLAWLEQYRQALRSHAIPLDEACVVGSAVLEAVGVRESTDIDCIVGPREPRFHAGVVKLGDGVDLVTRGYHRRGDGGATFADADVINNPLLHFRMRGLKFANPEIVIDRKRLNRRPKDVADVALWDARMSAPPAPMPTRTAVLWTGTPMDVVRQAELARLREDYAQRGIVLVVAGVPIVPALVAGPCIEAPPPVGSLAVHLFIDTDPCETLKQFGIAPAALLDAEAAVSGPASTPGHAFRRVRGFAWVARWMRACVDVVRPAEVIIETEGPCALVLRALARSCESTTIDLGRIADACRTASEQVRIVAHCSRQAR